MSLAFHYQKIPGTTKKPIALDVTQTKGEHTKDSISNRTPVLDILNYKLAFPTIDGISMERIRNVLFFEAVGNYTNVHLEDGRKILVSKTLKEFENKLSSSNFCRIHRSYLINLFKVSKYIKGRGGQVVLENGRQLAVSTRKKEEIIEIFNKFFI